MVDFIGISLEADWDAHFCKEESFKIKDINEFTRMMLDVESDYQQNDQRQLKFEEGLKKAAEQLENTCYMQNYFLHVMMSRIYERIKENLSQAIEPELKCESLEKQKLPGLTFTEYLKSIEDDMVNNANTLINCRKERQQLQSQASEELKKNEQDKNIAIANQYLESVINARKGIETGELSSDKLKEHQRASFTLIVEYYKGNDIRVTTIPGIKQANQLYKKLGEEIELRQKVAGDLQEIDRLLNESKEQAKQGYRLINEEDRIEFESKLLNRIKAGLYYYNNFRISIASKISAVLNFYDTIDKRLPEALKEKLVNNNLVIAEKKVELAKLKQASAEANSQGRNIQQQIIQLKQEVKNKFTEGAPSSGNKAMRAWLNKWCKELRGEVESLRNKVQSSSEVAPEHDISLPARLASLEIAAYKPNAESQKWLEDQNIAYYTDNLRNIYYKKFSEEIDINKAIDSAKFLNNQSFSQEIKEKAIEVVIHLVKHFDATFNNLYIKKDKGEIAILESSNVGSESSFSKVEFDYFGRLRIDDKKQKVFVTASPEDNPDVLILPVKAEVAYDNAAFAGGTPMLPGGTVGIEDFLEISKDHMNILAIAAKREFKEETREKYELAIKTLKKTKTINREENEEEIVFFKAKAKSVDANSNAKDFTEAKNTKGSVETKGLVLINVMDMIRDNKLSLYSTPFTREFTRKQAIVKEAQRQCPDLIAEVPEKQEDFRDGPKGKPQWGQYYSAYCTNHLVDYITDRIPEFIKQRQQISYKLLGSEDASWRTLSEDSDHGVRSSDSANWRTQASSSSSSANCR